MMVLTAMSEPGAVVYYVRRTLALAKETMWSEPRDGLPVVLRELGLVEGEHFTLNLSTTEVRLANGSCIRFKGIERSAWTDVRGFKLALLVLDEMQEQEDSGLKQALTADIPYTFMRYGGRFVGIGTPSTVPIGLFHDICEDVPDPETGLGQRTGWVVHRWTARALADKTPVWAEMLARKERFRIPDNDPWWLRDGLGQWAADDLSLILAVPDDTGLWTGDLPSEVRTTVPTVWVPRSEPMHVAAGLDFGFKDPNAVVVLSASREEGILRELHSDKRADLLNDDLAAWLRQVMDEFRVEVFYADHARPDTIATLTRLYDLPIVPCDKGDYDVRLVEMRTMMRQGRLQVRDGSKLHQELRVLEPDQMRLKTRREVRPKPGMEDHCFDGFRYCFNGMHTNFVAHPSPPLPPMLARERELQEMAARRPDPHAQHRTAGFRRR